MGNRDATSLFVAQCVVAICSIGLELLLLTFGPISILLNAAFFKHEPDAELWGFVRLGALVVGYAVVAILALRANRVASALLAAVATVYALAVWIDVLAAVGGGWGHAQTVNLVIGVGATIYALSAVRLLLYAVLKTGAVVPDATDQ
jgi:hypothetical protein